MQTDERELFQPFRFRSGVTIENRMAMAPMTTWAGNTDLTVSEDEIEYYKIRVNGVGLVITGCTHVTKNGQGFTDEFAAYEDSYVPSLKRLAETAKSGGAPAVLQIFHAGNKTLPDLDVVGPSDISGDSKTVRELTNEEILDIIEAFKETTRRAVEAGFDGVEIHGAHGFLVQNFWSPGTNKRTDEWGGSLEKRLRFPHEVIKAVRSAIDEYAQKPFMLGYRLSPEESSDPDGLRIEDTFKLVEFLETENIDYVHISLGDAAGTPVGNYDQPTVRLISERTELPVMAAGSIATPEAARNINSLGADLIAVGRGLIIDPRWVELFKENQEESIETVIKKSDSEHLKIPDKLWKIFEQRKGWLNIEE
ncbi:NADH-dependent flavin oxidoreductase [Corticicoccus populi]|uniref:NADH-dependent flavin oxidoreductase n=1 Tax=Corticicoccus populi TaxID=1812821 RepID=A0ABW5WXS7_9STAP